MKRSALLQEFESLGDLRVDLSGFALDLTVVMLLAWFLGRFYARYARTMSNRESFSKNFIPIAVATMFVITVVKSSLALSLGLVGALSIVRFRAAFKEPEELSYLFLAIALGVGMGAGQRALTLITFTALLLVLFILRRSSSTLQSQGLYMTVSGRLKCDGTGLIAEVLRKHCTKLKLRKWNEAAGSFEAAFMADFKSFDDFQKGKAALLRLDGDLRIGLMDAEGFI